MKWLFILLLFIPFTAPVAILGFILYMVIRVFFGGNGSGNTSFH